MSAVLSNLANNLLALLGVAVFDICLLDKLLELDLALGIQSRNLCITQRCRVNLVLDNLGIDNRGLDIDGFLDDDNGWGRERASFGEGKGWGCGSLGYSGGSGLVGERPVGFPARGNGDGLGDGDGGGGGADGGGTGVEIGFFGEGGCRFVFAAAEGEEEGEAHCCG